MKSYRMITPPNADPATLRWAADYLEAAAVDRRRDADTLEPKHPDAARAFRVEAIRDEMHARAFRARAGRIEGKQKRGKRAAP